MWPWGHLAVGYLLYTVYTRYRYLAPPNGLAVAAVAFGTQVPDLIDKPLAYWWLLPEGRTLGHSLVFMVPVCVLVLWIAREKRERNVGVAFVIGYATHLLGDSFLDLVNGDLEMLSFLAWPLLSAPDYEAAGFGHHFEDLMESVRMASESIRTASTVTFSMEMEETYFLVQLLLFLLMLLVWIGHRMPPLPTAIERAEEERPLTTEE